MRGWRSNVLLAITVLLLFLVIQLAIPVNRFGNPEITARFGWQMFAGFVPAPQISVVTADGEHPISLDEYMAWPRADIDIIRYLPAHLCSVVPGAISVDWVEGSLEC